MIPALRNPMNWQPVLFCSWALALLLPFGSPAQPATWSQLPGSPAGTSPRNDDIYFIHPAQGWSARATDGIYRTTNGGTFSRILGPTIAYPGTNLLPHFRSIGFASASRGWAGNLGPASYDNSVTDTNMLYETFDGGSTWSPVPAINASEMKGFCALHVLDGQHIYGGGSWWVTNLTAAGVMGGIMDVYFHDPQQGFLVGMNTNAYTTTCSGYRGTIARTSNGGLIWTNVVTTPVTCSYFWKMSWPSPSVGYATLQQNGSYDTVIFYKTTDGGASWSSNGIPLSALGVGLFFLQGVGFATEQAGWMGGSSTVAAPFNFIHTMDGGLTWHPAGYDNTQSINRIRFLHATFGYASGRKLHVFRVPLALTAPPTNQTLTLGSDAIFAVGAAGTAPLAYQWRFHGTNLNGANTPLFTVTNAQSADAGPYSVVVSDYSGALTSAVATLTVVAPPPPLRLSSPRVTGGWFAFDLATEPPHSYTVEWASNLLNPDWMILTNLPGNGLTNEVKTPWQSEAGVERYFRVRRP